MHGLDEHELRHVSGVVLQVFGHQMQPEHLTGVFPAEDRRVLRQRSVGQHPGGQRRVLHLQLSAVAVAVVQSVAALAQGLDMGGDGVKAAEAVFDEQAVVHAQPLGVDDPVAQGGQGVVGLAHGARHQVAGGHDAVVGLAAFQHLNDPLRVDGGDVFRGDEALVLGKDHADSFGVAAGDTLIGDLHKCVYATFPASYSPMLLEMMRFAATSPSTLMVVKAISRSR